MNCQLAQETIFEWLDDESRRPELRSHCQTCGECRSIVEALESLDVVLSSEEPDAKLPQRLGERLKLRLATRPIPLGVKLRRWWEALRSDDNPVKLLLQQRPLAHRGYALAAAGALYAMPGLYFAHSDPQAGSLFLAFTLLLSALLIPCYLVTSNLRLVVRLQRGRCLEEIVSAGIAPQKIVDTLVWLPLIQAIPLLLLAQLLMLTRADLAGPFGCIELTLMVALQYFALGWVAQPRLPSRLCALVCLGSALVSAVLISWMGLVLLLPLAYSLFCLRGWSISGVASYLNQSQGRLQRKSPARRSHDDNPIVHRYARNPGRPAMLAFGLASAATWACSSALMGLGRLDPLAGYALGLSMLALLLFASSALRVVRVVNQERQGSTWESLVCTRLTSRDYLDGWHRVAFRHALVWLALALPSVWLLIRTFPFQPALGVCGLGSALVTITLLGASRVGTDLGIQLTVSRHPHQASDLVRWMLKSLAVVVGFVCCLLFLGKLGESLAIFGRNAGRGGDFLIFYRTFAPAAATLAGLWLTLAYRWILLRPGQGQGLLSFYLPAPEPPWYFNSLWLGLVGALAGTLILTVTEKREHLIFLDLLATLALGCVPLAQWGLWLIAPWSGWFLSRTVRGFLLRAVWLSALLILPQWVLAHAIGYVGLLYLSGLWLNPIVFHLPELFQTVALTSLGVASLLAVLPIFWLEKRQPEFVSSGKPLLKAGVSALAALLLIKWGLPTRYTVNPTALSESRAIYAEAYPSPRSLATLLPDAPEAPLNLNSIVEPPRHERSIVGPILDDAECYRRLVKLNARWTMRDFNFKEILTAANSLPSTGMLNYQQCNRWTRALWISAVGSRAQPGRELDFLQVLTRLDPYGDHDEFFHTPWLLEQMASSAKSPEDRKRLHALLEIWKQDQNFWKRRLRAQFVHVVGLYNGKLEGLLPDFIKDYRAAEEIKFFEGQPTRGDLDLGFLGGPGAAGMKMRKYWRTRCDLEFVEVKLALEEARGPAGYPAEMPPPGWDTERTWEYRSWGSGYELKVAAPRAPLWSRRCGQDYTFWEREVRSPGQAAERL